MFKISNAKTEGFGSLDSEIIIREKNGKVFYLYKNPKKMFCEFNLPKGNFYTNNKLAKLTEPKKYKLPQLPPFERRLKIPAKIRISYGKNKNKCSVFLEEGKIIFDKDFKRQLSTPTFVFVICHELGHYYYGGHNPVKEPKKYLESETKCDIFAIKLMLKNGYNPSQIVLSSRFSLSDVSEERKLITENFCKHA